MPFTTSIGCGTLLLLLPVVLGAAVAFADHGLGARLAPRGDAADGFGWSTSISGNGKRALVGANRGNGLAGEAYVFERADNGAWAQAARLTADDALASDFFGTAVSISGDGRLAFVGMTNRDSETGSVGVYAFERAENGTWAQAQKLTNGRTRDKFGCAVSSSHDGGRVIVGAKLARLAGRGAAYVFEREQSGAWAQTAGLTVDDAMMDNFGWSVSISGDGRLAAVGTLGSTAGWGRAAFVFERAESGAWAQSAKLAAAEADACGGVDYFGSAVSIADGGAGLAIVGASGCGHAPGSAYVFERGGNGTWAQAHKLAATEGVVSDLFGWSVSTSSDGTLALVGASGSKSAYVFERAENGTWVQSRELTASDGDTGILFGTSATIVRGGDGQAFALVGGLGPTFSNEIGIDVGAAYVFDGNVSGACAQNEVSGRHPFRCVPCRAFEYKQADGQICASCPQHTTSPEGSVGILSCSAGAGFFLDTDSKLASPCPAGRFCAGAGAVGSASTSPPGNACPPGTYCPPGSAAARLCDAGFVCATSASRTACNAGEYCPSGTTMPSPCPAGSLCVTPSAAVPCPTGSYCPAGSSRASACSLCGGGEVLSEECTASTDTVCSAASAGRASAPGASTAERASVGVASSLAAAALLGVLVRACLRSKSRRPHPVAAEVRLLLRLDGVGDFESALGAAFVSFVAKVLDAAGGMAGGAQLATAIASDRETTFVTSRRAGWWLCWRVQREPSAALMGSEAFVARVASEVARVVAEGGVGLSACPPAAASTDSGLELERMLLRSPAPASDDAAGE